MTRKTSGRRPHTHVVTVDYQTANGNPASVRVPTVAADHDQAIEIANAHVATFKRFGRIQGGTVEEIQP